MNLEKLEKLNELREKGVLTQKEFNEEKKKLLTEKDEEKKNNKEESKSNVLALIGGISWKNVIFSALIALTGYILLIILSYLDGEVFHFYDWMFISKLNWGIMAVIMTLFSLKMKTSKYQYHLPFWVVLPVVFFLKFFGTWLVAYQLLQIKKKRATLKDDKNISENKKKYMDLLKNKKAIVGILAAIGLSSIYFCFFSANGLGVMGKNGFTAVITCTYQGSGVPLLACYDRTDLKVTSGNFSKIYSKMEIAQRDGQIDLPQHFKLVTQNSHDTFLLNLSIIDNATNQELFRDSASQYGVIRVSN